MKKKKLYFIILKSLNEHRLEELTETIRIIDSGLKNEFEEWGKWYEEETNGLSNDEKTQFIDHYYEDLAMVRDAAPNMARQALCVCLSGYFETLLADLCRFLYSHKGLSKQHRQRLYLEDSKTYLTETAGLAKNLFRAKGWNFCVKASYVRNAIAHYNGRIPKKLTGKLKDQADEAIKFIKYTKGIKLSNHNDILVENEYCDLLISNIKECSKTILTAVESNLSERP